MHIFVYMSIISLAGAATSIIFVAINMCLLWQSCDKSMLAVTKLLLCNKIVCHDKIFTKVLPQQTRVCHNKSFVMTSILFSWQKTFFATAKCVCQTQLRLSWHILVTTKLLSQTYASMCLSWQKSYLWQLPPMTLLYWLLEQAYWHVL